MLAQVAAAEPIASKLRALQAGESRVAFSHVTEAAQPFLVAALAHKIRRTLWIICPTVRSQELLYETLLNWSPDAVFLPEAEFAAVENIIPDPEISAERLALLSRVSREGGPHLIVATCASLDQPAPKTAALNSAFFCLKRGAHETIERLIGSLDEAGYERVAQVTTRGQFAVRGGIFDLFSWQAQLPIRMEFFGDEIESLREFDLDTQTAVRNLQAVDVLLGARRRCRAESCATTSRKITSKWRSSRRRIGGSKYPDQRGLDRRGRHGRLTPRRFRMRRLVSSPWAIS